MTTREFVKRAKYFELLLEVIEYAEEVLGARSLLAVSAYITGYEFAMIRANRVEIGFARLMSILEEIVRPEAFSFFTWPAVLIRQCGSEEVAYARFWELIAHEAEKERNEE
jgi:hypothetical protein